MEEKLRCLDCSRNNSAFVLFGSKRSLHALTRWSSCREDQGRNGKNSLFLKDAMQLKIFQVLDKLVGAILESSFEIFSIALHPSKIKEYYLNS